MRDGAHKHLSLQDIAWVGDEASSGTLDALASKSSQTGIRFGQRSFSRKGECMDRKHLFFIAMLVVVSLLGGNRAFAQDSASQPMKQDTGPTESGRSGDSQALSDRDIQLLRKDLRSQKKQIVAANMELTDAEAEKFWPVYDQYTADLSKINDTKSALIKEYMQNFTVMNGDQAESYIRRRAAVENDVMQLRLKYIPTFRRVLSGRQTALFFQIDWRLGLLIDMQLAQMPLINP